mmetsp:Transcript_11183/g.27490  ORF Transcript_11183/g.27490 Transcript_11183/m.27490 type:complete len:261 (-) Transcript_11183:79-861(-)
MVRRRGRALCRYHRWQCTRHCHRRHHLSSQKVAVAALAVHAVAPSSSSRNAPPDERPGRIPTGPTSIRGRRELHSPSLASKTAPSTKTVCHHLRSSRMEGPGISLRHRACTHRRIIERFWRFSAEMNSRFVHWPRRRSRCEISLPISTRTPPCHLRAHRPKPPTMISSWEGRCRRPRASSTTDREGSASRSDRGFRIFRRTMTRRRRPSGPAAVDRRTTMSLSSTTMASTMASTMLWRSRWPMPMRLRRRGRGGGAWPAR